MDQAEITEQGEWLNINYNQKNTHETTVATNDIYAGKNTKHTVQEPEAQKQPHRGRSMQGTGQSTLCTSRSIEMAAQRE